MSVGEGKAGQLTPDAFAAGDTMLTKR
jgi:hypothetical protein